MQRLTLILIFICTVILILAGCETSKQSVIVTAHRGASGLAPENTMSAMLRAIQEKSDLAELDVQETSDGVIILLHDNTLLRTAGLEKNIWEMDFASLDGIDVGAWFKPEFRGEPIPTLEAVIDSVQGKMKLNIELKMNGHEKMLEERVLKIIEDKDFEDQCIVTSFKFEAIDKVKALNPKIKAGYIFSKMQEETDVFSANVDLLSVNYKILNLEFVEKAHARNKEVHVWTVDDPDEMKRLIDLGVDSIITNRPDILRGILSDS